jgi:ABC-type Fe3+-citrate transport system substrate-binding protein
MRGFALGAGILVVALVVAGCGGGGDETSTNTISKAVFIKKGNAICQKGSERMVVSFTSFLEKEKSSVKHPSQATKEELVGEALVPSVKREIKEFEALGAPSGDEDRVGEIIKALEEGLETAESNPEAVVSSSDAVFGIPSRLAGEYGLEVCGNR